MKKAKFTFAVGIARSRTVTVHAENMDDARLRAIEALDRRAEKSGAEPPVAWDIELVKFIPAE